MESSRELKIIGAYFLFMLLISVCGGVSAASTGGLYVPNEVIVRYNDMGSNVGTLSVSSQLNAELGATQIIGPADLMVPRMHVMQIPDGTSVPDAISYYESSEYVESAEPNYIVNIFESQVIPDDPDFSLQWGLYNNTNETNRADIHAPEAWSITTGSSDVIVAVIDTGVDYNHEDLSENCIQGYDFVNNDAEPMDDNGHGTHCAGIIGAVTNNEIGIAGISWYSKIMPIKAFDLGGSSDTVTLIKSIAYAREHGADIISCSWGGYNYSQSLKDAIDETDALFVCAAGNDASNNDITPVYPANYVSGNIISVGATDKEDELASFSNYGKTTVDLMAPGYEIYSTSPEGSEYSPLPLMIESDFLKGAGTGKGDWLRPNR